MKERSLDGKLSGQSLWTKAFGLPYRTRATGDDGQEWSQQKISGMWALGLPGCSPHCPLLQPPHISAAHLSHTHRNRYMNTHCRPVGGPLWKGCWKLSGPPLLCTEEGLRLREGRVLCRSHTTHLGQGLELSLALSIAHPMVQSPAPSCPLFPTTEPFSQPPLCVLGEEA